MRLLQLLTAALLPLCALAAKKSSGERYTKYQAEQVANGGPIKLDDKSYEALTKAPRDYAVAVVFTALDARFGCAICNEFQPEWEVLSRSWIKGDKDAESKLIFATLDFMEGKATFQSLMLQTAPVLLLFHPTIGPHARDDVQSRYDFGTGASGAENIHAWLSRQLPDRPHPPLVRPINYVRITVGVTAVLGLITLFTVAAPYVLPIIQNRNLWAAVSLLAILLFTSGQMFNYIRKVPYIMGDGRGGVSYFAGGFQNQVGLETQIIAAIYGILSFATISLALKVPRIADPRLQQFSVLVWSGILLGVYSFLISIFKLKNNGYPFWLPPFV